MTGRARRATRPTPCLFGAAPELRADFVRIENVGVFSRPRPPPPGGAVRVQARGRPGWPTSHDRALSRHPVLPGSSADARDPPPCPLQKATVLNLFATTPDARSLANERIKLRAS